MTPEENVNRMRLGFQEIWNEKHPEKIDEYYSPDLVSHGFGAEDGDLDTYREWYDLITGAFPDIEFELGEVFSDGDLTTATWQATATHEGEFMGIAPTGNSATVSGITVSRYEDGKAVESWMNFDSLKLLQVMEVLPELEPTAT